MSGLSHVIVEADGGSRGNPGPAAYGALVRDPATGEVIAQDGKTLGIATNKRRTPTREIIRLML